MWVENWRLGRCHLPELAVTSGRENWVPSQDRVPSTAEEKEKLRHRRCQTYPQGSKCFPRLEGTGGQVILN